MTAWCFAVGTEQQQCPPTVAWQYAPGNSQNCSAPIESFQLHVILCCAGIVRINVACETHSFLNFTTVPLVLPHQQIRDFSRIVKIASHQPSRDDGHVLAVESRPRANEVLMPPARLFSLLHRLIPVIVLSNKIPLRGCVLKESVKVRTPKFPTFSDDFSPDFTAFYVFPHRSCAQAQHFGCLAEREECFPDWTAFAALLPHSFLSRPFRYFSMSRLAKTAQF